MLVMMGAPRGCVPSCGSATRPRAHTRNVEAGTSTIRAASDIVYSGSLNLDGSRAVISTSLRRAYSSIKERLFLARLTGGGLSDAGGYHLGYLGEDARQLEG